MSVELNFVISILDRSRAASMVALYKGLPLVLTLLGYGTATSEHLSLYGLDATEKAIIASVADKDKTRRIMRDARRKLYIDVPGNGIMMAVPVKSVGGGRTLNYLTDNAAPGSSAPEMNFEHELIIVVLNEGYNEMVMDAARAAGAFGGTVLHAKGSGKDNAEKFLGVSLAEEKEVIFIVTGTAEKTAIMKAIITQTGVNTPAGAICFSLPISEVAGLRNFDSDDEE